MRKGKKVNKPVIHWDMTIRCRSRDQAHAIITRLLKEDIDFDFDVEHQLLSVGEQWVVSINDMPWGNNIKTVGRIVSKEDAEA